MDMLFSRRERVPSYHILWKAFVQMWLAEASTMAVSYRECEKRLHLFPSNLPFHMHRKINKNWTSSQLISSYYFSFFNIVLSLSLSLSPIYSVRLEQGTVMSLLEDNGTVKGVHYKTRNGQELTAHASLTVVCDGCFSNLRRSLCKPKVKDEKFSLYNTICLSTYY